MHCSKRQSIRIIKQLKPLINGKLIYLSQYGSHLYGLNTENSDLDFRGIYIPTLDDIILKKDKDEINTELEVYLPINDIIPTNIVDIKVDNIEQRLKRISKWDATNTLLDGVSIKKKVDIKIFSLQKFIQLCSKADTNALDLLFSVENNFIEKYIEYNRNVTDSIIWQLYSNRSKLINTDRLESPITYAFKQATKYGLKGERLKVLELVKQKAKYLKKNKILAELRTVVVGDLIDHTDLMELEIPNNHLRIDVLDNKGKKEKYLFVCGVQHQFNVDLNRFIKRIQEKIDKEYTSQRTKDAKDGNDWKALSHALRILFEVKELMETGNITFSCKQKEFLLKVKNGQVSREEVDSLFEKELSNVLTSVKQNKLNWKYSENFWERFVVKEIKNDR